MKDVLASTIRSAVRSRLSFVWAGFSDFTQAEIDSVIAEVARLFVAGLAHTNGLRGACAQSESAADQAVVASAVHEADTMRLQDRIHAWGFVGADVARTRLHQVLCEIADERGAWLRAVVR